MPKHGLTIKYGMIWLRNTLTSAHDKILVRLIDRNSFDSVYKTLLLLNFAVSNLHTNLITSIYKTIRESI
jgi:hypothetical protein